MKFKYFVDLFLDIGRNEWKVSTFSKYEIIALKKFKFLHNIDIDKIKASQLKLWFSKKSVNLSSKTLKDYKSVLNQIFLLAKYDEFISVNPVEFIRLPNCKKPQIYPFTSFQVKQILSLAKFKSFKFYIFI